MSKLGYVVIEYNQASHWPSLWNDELYDSTEEASEAVQIAWESARERGRGETYAVARVEQSA